MATKPSKIEAINENSAVAEEIKDRLSAELVFALVGPLGSGVTTVANLIHEKLAIPYKYQCPPILKPSDVIREKAPLLGKSAPESVNSASYVDKMQDLGNELRKKYGYNYLVEKTI